MRRYISCRFAMRHDKPSRLQRPGHLHHPHRRPVARRLQRTPIRVKPVATPDRTLNLDVVVQRHPRSVNAKLTQHGRARSKLNYEPLGQLQRHRTTP